VYEHRLAVEPSEYASTLLRATGKYLIQHVYERACESRRAALVVVATDDPRIVAAVEGFGGRVVFGVRRVGGKARVALIATG